MKFDVCIRGAGVVGKSLALALARSRIRVALIDKAPSAKPDIRSFALNAASRDLLLQLRVWPESEQVQAVEHMRVFGQSEAPLRFDAQHAPLAWSVDAQALEDKLSQAIGFCPEISLSASESEAALTVICEGRQSETRQSLGTEFEQFDYGQSAIAARIECEKPHESTAWQWMNNAEICAFLPRVAAHEKSSEISRNSVALVWSVSNERAKQLLAMNAQDFIFSLQESCDQRLGTLQLASERAAWPLKLAQAQNWVGAFNAMQSWALAGDAAHSVHPLAGQGLNLGLADVRQLGYLLANKAYFKSYADLRTLRQYERSRKSEMTKLRFATDGLAQMFSYSNPGVQRLREWGLRSIDALPPLKTWIMRSAAGKSNAL